MKRIFLVGLLLSLFLALPVQAAEADTLINKQLELLDFEDATAEEVTDLSLKEMVTSLMKGELDLSPSALIEKGLNLLLGEVKGQVGLMRNLLLIALMSALLKTLNASFQGKSVGELGFYVCYVVLILLVVTTFGASAAMVRDTVDRLRSLMEGMLPAFTALAFAAGNYSFTVLAAPIIISVAQLLTLALRSLVLPGLTLVTVLSLVNHLSERKLLSELTSFFKGILSWGLKASAIAFVSLLSLLKIGTPAINQLVGKTAKTAVSAVPVVGEIMSGAVDMAATLAGMTGNSLAVGIVIFVFCLSLIPMLRLVAMVFIYKLTAAVVEPVSEARLVKALSGAGDFSLMLLGVLFAAEVMFLFAALSMVTIF